MVASEAITTVSVMWAMTAVSLIMVVLRLYTRIFVVHGIGADDHTFCVAWLFLFLYTVFLTVAGEHGYAQEIGNLDTDEAVKAVKMEMVGQTFAVLGMAIAKISLGLFLIRIVVQLWHKAAIWIAMVSLGMVSLLTAVVFWIQCIPAQSIFDPRVPGRCIVSVTPFAVLLGAWCVLVDFFFAGFPWVFIWRLQMKKKDKLILCFSMSLGVIAGACGVVRTIELAGLSSANYTKDTVSLIIWSAAELAVTMLCISLPVLRPLYNRIFQKGGSGDSGQYYKQKDSHSQAFSGYRMRTFGIDKSTDNVTVFGEGTIPVGVKGSTQSFTTGGNQSEEEILGPEVKQQSIMVRENDRMDNRPR